MSVSNVYKLTFMTNTGNYITFNIPRGDASLDPEDIMTSMQDMVDTGIIMTTKGKPIAAISAERIETTVTPISF